MIDWYSWLPTLNSPTQGLGCPFPAALPYTIQPLWLCWSFLPFTLLASWLSPPPFSSRSCSLWTLPDFCLCLGTVTCSFLLLLYLLLLFTYQMIPSGVCHSAGTQTEQGKEGGRKGLEIFDPGMLSSAPGLHNCKRINVCCFQLPRYLL